MGWVEIDFAFRSRAQLIPVLWKPRKRGVLREFRSDPSLESGALIRKFRSWVACRGTWCELSRSILTVSRRSPNSGMDEALPHTRVRYVWLLSGFRRLASAQQNPVMGEMFRE